MTSTHPKPTEIHWFPFTASTFKGLRTILRLRHGGSLRERIKSLSGFWMLLPFLFCTVCPSEPTASGGSLSVEVNLPPHAHGQIAYLVFNAPDGFPDTRAKALIHNFVPIVAEGAATERIDVGPLPPGRYAVSIYLDENGNRKLDKNWLGLPKEAVGASNNPRKRIGTPHFDDAAFIHGVTPQSIPITLVYCCKP